MDRNKSLDGIRAFSALIVLAFHTRLNGFGGGAFGVTIFFILSGFLITDIIVKEYETNGRIDYRRFQYRRILRLYPALLVMLITFSIVASFLFPTANILREVFLSGLYISNITFSMARVPDFTHHSWTLAMEMQFYLIWPIVIGGLSVCFKSRLFLAFSIMFIAFELWRCWVLWVGLGGKIYYGFDTRASSLVLGAMIATSTYRLSLKGANIVGIGAFIFLLLNLNGYILPGRPYYFSFLSVELAAALLILSVLRSDCIMARIFSIPPLPVLGLWSYSIYLWHYPIARYFRTDMNGVEATITVILISIALSFLTYRYVEMPVSKFRKKIL